MPTFQPKLAIFESIFAQKVGDLVILILRFKVAKYLRH